MMKKELTLPSRCYPTAPERTAQLSAFRVAAMRILVALSVFSTRLVRLAAMAWVAGAVRLALGKD